MFNIKQLDRILNQISKANAQLVVVTKTRGTETIEAIYQSGHHAFGENRVLELVDKYHKLPKDINWHMIGHLQRNKVKLIASYINMIHSIDSLKLLKEVNKQAKANDRVIPCLLQIHIAEESSKFGLDSHALTSLLENEAFKSMQHVKICGVMGMATFTNDEEQVKSEFQKLASIFSTTKEHYFKHDDAFKEISMGMSGDYELALECGSTMVRIGSLIFTKSDSR